MGEIEKQIESLNDQQREVALCENHCLAMAAPGSGKTKTLAVKAAYLLSRGKTVGAVTFTRDAALELRERIVHLAGKEALPRLLVGTFHSIDLLMCFPGRAKSGMGSEILRRGFSKITRPWELVKEGNRISAVMRAIERSGLDLELGEATAVIEGIKSGQVNPETSAHEELAKTYQSILARHGVIDFQDILLKTNEALHDGTVSPLHVDHLLMDEYQDTDLPQFTWSLNHKDSILTAVGDDDQSIYGFRRALGYKGMMDFATRLHATKVVLGMNYRSHAEVLAPASALIARNQDRMDKALVSFKGHGGLALWDKLVSRTLEAEQCIERARNSLAAGMTVGVLARSNKRLDEVEAQCIKHKVPYQRAEGGSILNSREMTVFMAGLAVVADAGRRDIDELLAWCGVQEGELNGLHAVIGENTPLISITRQQLEKVALTTESKRKIGTLIRRMQGWRTVLATGGVAFVVEKIYMLLSESTTDKRSQRALEVVQEIFNKPLAGETGDGIADMRSRLDHVRSMMKSPDKKEKPSGNAVHLLTAHGSKGLEFDLVWIIGAEDGAFPDEGASMQEERRLFYVAMTRARKILLISGAGKSPISPFVQEAGLARAPELLGLLGT